jgi:DNA sulfur modification protein DndB
LDPVIHFFKNIDEDQELELRSRHGSGGDTKYWRTLEQVVNETHSDFNPEGLQEYIKKEAKEFNDRSFSLVRELEQYLKTDFKQRLEVKFGKNWWKKGVPPDVYEKGELLASKKNREIENELDEVSPWDCLNNLTDHRKIVLKNWRDIYEKEYTKPGEEKLPGGKDAKTKWIVELGRIRNENFNAYSVTEEEFAFLTELHEWLILKIIKNKFQEEQSLQSI